MKRPCLGCGRVIAKGSRCRRCQKPSRRAPRLPGRGSGWTATRFRTAVLARAGGRCERCGKTTRLMAHHKVPVVDGGSNDPSNGEALCSGKGGCHWKAEAEWRRRKT